MLARLETNGQLGDRKLIGKKRDNMNDENYYDLNDDFIDDGDMNDGEASMQDSIIEESETGGTEEHHNNGNTPVSKIPKPRFYVWVP